MRNFALTSSGSLREQYIQMRAMYGISNRTPLEPGSTFSASKLFSELAVGSGIGFRFDFSFVVLRLDLAMPLRKPWLEENNQVGY